MSSIALTNAAGGESVQETVEIVIPSVHIAVPPANLVINPITTTTIDVCRQLADKSINLRPSYNRSYKWSMKKFRSYITHVWGHGAMLQSLTLYQLPADNEYECECIDGQHRMAALKHFYESSPIDELHSTDNMVYIISRGLRGTESVEVALFYAKTVHTEKWREQNDGRFASVQYLSDMPRLQRAFNRIAVQLQTITSPLSISERKRIFIDLQQGVKVTGDDLVRNLAIPLVEKIDAEVRTLYKETVIPQLMTKPSQYATHWLIRLYHLSCNQNDTAENHANLIFKDMDDKSLNQCLMAEKTLDAKEFVYDPVGYERFKRDVTRLSNFCKECAKLPTQPKLPPITMHAVYTYFSQMDDEKYANKLPMIVSWMERGQSDYIDNVQSRIRKELPEIKRNINKIWERTTKDETFEQKKVIYCTSVEILRGYAECRVMQPVLPKQKKARKLPAKNIRNKVWNDYYGAANNIAKCYVCDIKELDRNDTSCYDYAHIVPHSRGGKATVDNLIPTCKSCNSEMGQQNLKYFQEKHYPDVHARYV
jgi:hypothetical protein